MDSEISAGKIKETPENWSTAHLVILKYFADSGVSSGLRAPPTDQFHDQYLYLV